MSGLPWFRLYNEMVDDPKIGLLSDAAFRLWVNILCVACQYGEKGDTKLTIAEMEWKLRCNVSVTLQELLQSKLVTFHTNGNGKETIFIPKWETRQYQSDISTERVKKYREKQKRNVSETFQ